MARSTLATCTEAAMSDHDTGDSPIDADAIRASDAEREAIVERLNAACSEGRLTLDEFSDRVERTYLARTRRDLDALVTDLPAAADGPASTGAMAVSRPTSSGRTQWHVTPLGGLKRRGRWRVPEHTVSVTLMGGVSLDLCEAELAAREVTVTAVTVMGGLDVIVPSGVRVEVDGMSILGGRKVDVDERAAPGAPTIRLRIFSIMGGAKVRTSHRADRIRDAARSTFG